MTDAGVAGYQTSTGAASPGRVNVVTPTANGPVPVNERGPRCDTAGTPSAWSLGRGEAPATDCDATDVGDDDELLQPVRTTATATTKSPSRVGAIPTPVTVSRRDRAGRSGRHLPVARPERFGEAAVGRDCPDDEGPRRIDTVPAGKSQRQPRKRWAAPALGRSGSMWAERTFGITTDSFEGRVESFAATVGIPVEDEVRFVSRREVRIHGGRGEEDARPSTVGSRAKAMCSMLSQPSSLVGGSISRSARICDVGRAHPGAGFTQLLRRRELAELVKQSLDEIDLCLGKRCLDPDASSSVPVTVSDVDDLIA